MNYIKDKRNESKLLEGSKIKNASYHSTMNGFKIGIVVLNRINWLMHWQARKTKT